MSKSYFFVFLLIFSTGTALADVTDAHALEACINGDVSASGNYASQAEEDLALTLVSIIPDDEYALEPCINGGVSAMGTEAEDTENATTFAAILAAHGE